MKVMLCNIGWSAKYEGALLKGSHKFIKKHKGDGAERWNFKKFPNGQVYGYIRGMGTEHSPPQLAEDLRNNWTILFYAKDPGDQVLKFIGYYCNATIHREWKKHPINKAIQGDTEKHVYCATTSARQAILFPEDNRPIVGKGFGQAGFVYLTNPITLKVSKRNLGLYKRVLSYLKCPLSKLEGDKKKTRRTSPTCIDQEHRVAVEKAAMLFVTRQLRKEGFLVKDISREKIGFDLQGTRGADVLNVEVKGTAGTDPRFVITNNEIEFMEKDPSAVIAIVTTALGQPILHTLKGMNIQKAYKLRPLQLEAMPRLNNSHIISGKSRMFNLA